MPKDEEEFEDLEFCMNTLGEFWVRTKILKAECLLQNRLIINKERSKLNQIKQLDKKAVKLRKKELERNMLSQQDRSEKLQYVSNFIQQEVKQHVGPDPLQCLSQ